MSRSGVAAIGSDDAGERATARLGSERMAWMTTVDADGTPVTSPIWFLWDGAEVVVYSLESVRVTNIRLRPRVSINLDGNGFGGDIVVVEGTARIDPSYPSAAANQEYLSKYGPVMEERSWDPEWFAARYSVPIRITPTKFRYW